MYISSLAPPAAFYSHSVSRRSLCAATTMSTLLLLLLLPIYAAAHPSSSAFLRHHPRLSNLNRLLELSNLTAELDLRPSLTILAPHDAALQPLLDGNLSPEAIADVLRHHILPEYRSLDDLLALARDATPVPTLYRPQPGMGSLRLTLEGGNSLRAELADGSSGLIRKSLLEVPARISVLETSNVIVSLAAAPTAATSPTSGPAPAPAPIPVNVIQIMVSAGQFSTFISLLQSSKVDVTFQSLANQTNTGISIFCPTNEAFSSLPSGFLKNLTSQQLVSLLEYHAMPSYHPLSTFQQTSNSVFNTLATQGNGYTFNVTNEQGIVELSTGYDNADLVSTLYNTPPGALFAIDHVLLPEEIFGLPAPTPAPSPSTPAPAPSSSTSGSGKGSTAAAPAPTKSHAPPLLSMRAFLLATMLLCGFKSFLL